MRINLPLCSFKDCKHNFDGNCKDAKRKEKCEFSIFSEKQIPKRVNNRALIALSFPAYLRGDCPVCGSKNLSSADTDYCNVCGQKLDFGEIEKEKDIPPGTIDITGKKLKFHMLDGYKNY